MNILITGSNGFIGKSLSYYLSNKKDLKIYKDDNSNDLSDWNNWEKFKRCDVVIHLASKTNSAESNKKSKIYLENNISSAINGLEYCRKYKAKFIFISSYIYSRNENLPVSENSEIDPTNSYSLSKKIIEDICIFYRNKLNVQTLILRPSNVYGPDLNSKSFIIKILKAVLNDYKFIINSMKIKRDYIYIDDLIDGIYKSIYYRGKYYIFNIGRGESISHEKIVNFINSHKNIKFKINYENKNLKNKDETLMNIGLIKKEMNWEPKIDIYRGIEIIIKTLTN